MSDPGFYTLFGDARRSSLGIQNPAKVTVRNTATDQPVVVVEAVDGEIVVTVSPGATIRTEERA